jgi:hypothetical protein
VNAADSEGGDGELLEEEELPVDDKWEGRARRGRTLTLRAWVLGMGFGSPLVPEEWKTCDTESGSMEMSSIVGMLPSSCSNVIAPEVISTSLIEGSRRRVSSAREEYLG